MPSKEIVVSIDFYNHDTSIEIALAAAKEFRVGKNQARLILEEVRSAVSQWRSVASALGISRNNVIGCLVLFYTRNKNCPKSTQRTTERTSPPRSSLVSWDRWCDKCNQ